MILRIFELRNSVSFCGKAEKFIEVKKEKKSQVYKAPGFPSGSDSKESACHAGDLRWVAWQPTQVLLPEEFHGQRSLVGYSSWGHKELDRTDQLKSKSLQRFYSTYWNVNWLPYINFSYPLQYSDLENSMDCVYMVLDPQPQHHHHLKCKFFCYNRNSGDGANDLF